MHQNKENTMKKNKNNSISTNNLECSENHNIRSEWLSNSDKSMTLKFYNNAKNMHNRKH